MNETELERLVVRLIGDSSSYQRMTKEATQATRNMTDEIEVSDNRIQLMSKRVNLMGLQFRGFGGQMAALGASVLGFGGAIASVFKGVKLAGAAELMESNFKVMLGSAEQARQMVGDIQKFAAETPLNTGDLQRFAKMLLQAGVGAEELLLTIRMLGDAALGDSQKIQGLAYAFGQVKTFGRLMGGELIQLRNAGFDPLAEISRTTGRSIGDLRKEMERGQISFGMVQEAFRTATSEGGRFADGMKEASTTLSGLFSTMQDDIDAALRTLGKDVVELFSLKQVMKEISSAVQAGTKALQEISPETKKMIVGLVAGGAAAAAMVAAMIALKVIIGGVVGLVAMLGPFGIAMVATFAAASAGIAVLVNRLGGVGPALDYIKAQATAAWEWLEPVRAAVGSLAETITNLLTRAWESVKASAEEAWERLTGGADINWNRIREVATRAIYLIEFSLLNLGKVGNLLWIRMRYDAVRAFNEIEHFHTTILPAAAKHANGLIINAHVEMWSRFKAANAKAAELFIQANVDMFRGAKQLVVDYVKFHVNAVRGIPDLISGALDIAKEFAPGGKLAPSNVSKVILDQFRGASQTASQEAEKVGKAMAEAADKGFKTPKRQEGDLEKQLREEWEQASKGLRQDLDQFILNRKVRDAFRDLFRPQGEGERVPYSPAAKQNDQITESAKKASQAMKDLRVVFVDSVEGMRLIDAQNEAIGTNTFSPKDTRARRALADQGRNQMDKSTRELMETANERAKTVLIEREGRRTEQVSNSLLEQIRQSVDRLGQGGTFLMEAGF